MPPPSSSYLTAGFEESGLPSHGVDIQGIPGSGEYR